MQTPAHVMDSVFKSQHPHTFKCRLLTDFFATLQITMSPCWRASEFLRKAQSPTSRLTISEDTQAAF